MSDSERLERENRELRAKVARLEDDLLDARDDLDRLQSQHDVLENVVFGLEREHEQARAAVERTRAELAASYARLTEIKGQQDDILASIDQGLLTVDRDLVIGSEHSRAALRILGRDRLAGLPLPSIFAHDPELAEKVRAFASLALESPHASDAMLARLSPIRLVRMPVPDGGERVLAFTIVRVRPRELGPRDVRMVQRLLVVVDDRTHEDRLERELAQRTREHEAKIERAYQILTTPPALFTDLVEEAQSAIAMARALRASEPPLPLLRSVHTLKGNARALGLDGIAEGAHDLEDALAAREIERLEKAIARVESELRDGVAIFDQLVEVRSAIQSRATGRAAELEAMLRRAADQEAAARGVRAELRWRGEIDEARAARVAALTRGALVAMVRNAIAHGAQPPEARRAAGKPEALAIEVRLAAEGESIVVACRDDGRGVDRARLVARAVELRVLEGDAAAAMAERDLGALLAVPGLSTADSVDLGAGRGVGMDIVREIAESLGGRVMVASEPGRSTEVRIEFPSAALLDWSPAAPADPGQSIAERNAS